MTTYKPLLSAILSATLVHLLVYKQPKKPLPLRNLNDLHARVVPHTDVVSDGNGGTKVEKRGGLTTHDQTLLT